MSKQIVLAMGANHIDHDKLIAIASSVGSINTVGIKGRDDIAGYMYAQFRIHPEIRYTDQTWIGEQKIDGFSYIADNGEFISRKLSEAKGSEGMPIIKTGHVPHLSQYIKSICECCDADIHGELYKPGGTSDDVTKIMGCTEDKARLRQSRDEDKLHYMIHDIRRFDGQSTINDPWYIRRALLEYWYERYVLPHPVLSKYVHLSEVITHDVFPRFTQIIRSGGEGMMFKNTRATYVPGKKPANIWVKCKKEVTLDAVIMGLNYEGASGKNTGLFRSIRVGLWDGQGVKYIGDVHSGISDELRRDMKNDTGRYINRVVEVDAMDFNGKSWSLRHGRLKRFRDDKSIGECTTNGLRFKEVI